MDPKGAVLSFALGATELEVLVKREIHRLDLVNVKSASLKVFCFMLSSKKNHSWF